MRTRRGARGRGVALLLVLWITAALALLVTGLLKTQRVEVRSAQVLRNQVRAYAIGQAAIATAIQKRFWGQLQLDREHNWVERLDGVDVEMRAAPLTGWVDLNRASVDLFRAVLKFGCGLDDGATTALGDRFLAWRSERTAAGSVRRFETVEELLSVDGVDVDLFQCLSPMVATGTMGQAGVNPLAAPAPLLQVLAKGDAAAAARFRRLRAESSNVDMSELDTSVLEMRGSRRIRFNAKVADPDGRKSMVLIQDIDLNPSRASAGWWSVMRSEVMRGPADGASLAGWLDAAPVAAASAGQSPLQARLSR